MINLVNICESNPNSYDHIMLDAKLPKKYDALVEIQAKVFQVTLAKKISFQVVCTLQLCLAFLVGLKHKRQLDLSSWLLIGGGWFSTHLIYQDMFLFSGYHSKIAWLVGMNYWNGVTKVTICVHFL